MTTIHVDSALSDDTRREALYRGDLFVYSPSPAALELVRFTRALVEEAFAPRDPRLAQHEMAVEDYAALLAELKPRFIHHPRCKELLPAILAERGCDPEATYFDVPRLRSSTSGGYLTTGIAYAFHPHRDTWYSAPACQINWWLPLWEIGADEGMAFHPAWFDRPVKNGSRFYNYQEWNRTSRQVAAQQVGRDTRRQPMPEEPLALEPDIRLLPQPGGLIVFSGAQLHSSIPNQSGRTRFSIDFRTVHIADVEGRRGAPNVDAECTGTPMNDYLRMRDLAHVPEALQALYDAGTPLARARA